MTSEQWLRVKDEFEKLRATPADSRSRFLEEVGDEEVRHELEELLHAYDGSQEFLERPAVVHEDVLAKNWACGQRLGRFSLVRQVGEGGMGVMYEAVCADGELEQRVAIKVVKQWLTSEREMSRFRAERQILARLEHAN